MASIQSLPFESKLEEVLRRSLSRLGPEAKAEIAALLTPEALKTVAAVLVAWVASHAFGLGEVIDVILLAVGAVAIGLAMFQGVDELYLFAVGTHDARTDADLDAAAAHFARAISILGVQAVLAVLFHGAPKSYRGGLPRRAGPITKVGEAYRPSLKWTKYEKGVGRLPAGQGWTTSWGDSVLSSRGSADTRQVTMLHERIHQILTPKLYFLRDFRIANRNASYKYSSLSRYLEEALAESAGQIGTFGVQNSFIGIRFPVKNGYVYLLRSGSRAFAELKGSGVFPELGGMVVGAIEAAGARFEVLVGKAGAQEPTSGSQGHGASGTW